jgi:hypothetical protein
VTLFRSQGHDRICSRSATGPDPRGEQPCDAQECANADIDRDIRRCDLKQERRKAARQPPRDASDTDGALLRAERHHRVHTRGASRGRVRRSECDDQQRGG